MQDRAGAALSFEYRARGAVTTPGAVPAAIPDYQFGNRGLPGLSRALSCEADCPRVTVRYQLLPG
jgi:hypothetical protein